MTTIATMLRARSRAFRWCISGLMLAAAACADHAATARATADSDLARDLALAGNSSAQPTFQDTAVAPAPTPASQAAHDTPAPVHTHAAPSTKPKVETHIPRRVAQAPVQQAPAPVLQAPAPAPVPQAPAPAPAPATIGSGTGMALTSGSQVCTSTNMPGDKLVATVSSPITGTNGAVIPAGSQVVLEVASVTPAQNGDAQITFRVRSVIVNDKAYNVAADVTPLGALQKTQVANADAGSDKKKVIGGAIAGAILGQLIGHNTKGTIIGAAAGAATGAVVAKAGNSAKSDACLPAGAPMRLTLDAPLVLST